MFFQRDIIIRRQGCCTNALNDFVIGNKPKYYKINNINYIYLNNGKIYILDTMNLKIEQWKLSKKLKNAVKIINIS